MQQPEDVQKPSRYHPRKSDDPRFQQKMEALSSAFVPVVFPPAKRLAIRENESLLKRLGLWDFVNIDFDEVLNLNLIMELIVSFNNNKTNAKKKRCQLGGQHFGLNSQAIAKALHLPKKGNLPRTKEEVEGCSVSVSEEEGLFLEDFIWNFLLISDDGSRVYHLEPKMIEFAESLKERRFDITQWAELVQFMVEKELLRGTRLTRCYYASHLHTLIKKSNPNSGAGHSGAAQSILTKCDDRRRDISDESDSKGKKIIIEEDDGGSKMEMETETVDVSCSSPERVNESVSRFIDSTHSKMEELQNINKMLHKQIEEQQKQLQEEQERYEFMLQIVEGQQKEFQEKQLQFQEQLGRAEVFEEDVIYQFAEMKISEERSVEEINGLKNLLSSVEKKAKEYCNVIEILKQQLRFAEEKAKIYVSSSSEDEDSMCGIETVDVSSSSAETVRVARFKDSTQSKMEELKKKTEEQQKQYEEQLEKQQKQYEEQLEKLQKKIEEQQKQYEEQLEKLQKKIEEQQKQYEEQLEKQLTLAEEKLKIYDLMKEVVEQLQSNTLQPEELEEEATHPFDNFEEDRLNFEARCVSDVNTTKRLKEQMAIAIAKLNDLNR